MIVQIPTISPLVLQMLAFEVFIIHLSSSSGEGTCSVLLNYWIFFLPATMRQEANNMGRETEEETSWATKFPEFSRTWSLDHPPLLSLFVSLQTQCVWVSGNSKMLPTVTIIRNLIVCLLFPEPWSRGWNCLYLSEGDHISDYSYSFISPKYLFDLSKTRYEIRISMKQMICISI